MDNRPRAMPENASPLVSTPPPDAPAGQPLQTAAVVSTHSVAGLVEGAAGSQLKVSEAPTGLPSVTMSPGDLPHVFGRYRVQKKLGSGAMGAVYLAEDTLLQRRVAIKTPIFENDKNGELLRRFYREARALANLKHPNLCAVYDVGELEGRHYISMEFVPGKKLQEFIRPDKPMAEKHAMGLVRKIALAMHEAHTHGLIHRDLKPDNIIINEKGDPVVMDFGLVHKADSHGSARLTQHGSLIGSPAYMSKEQVEGDPEKLTTAVDQYSLGVILYQLLTSSLPFEGGLHAVLAGILTREPAPPSQLRPDLNPYLEVVCLKMMAKEAEDRYPSMKAVADAIAEVAKSNLKSSGSGAVPAASAGLLTGRQTQTRSVDSVNPEKMNPLGASASTSSQKGPIPIQIQGTNPAPRTTLSPSRTFSSFTKWWTELSAAARWTLLTGTGTFMLAIATILYVKVSNATGRQDINDASRSTITNHNSIAAEKSVLPAAATSSMHPDTSSSELDSKESAAVLRGPSARYSDLDRIAIGKWIPLDYSTGVLSVPQPLEVQNGVLELKRARMRFPGIVASNIILRAEVLKLSGLHMSLNLRSSDDTPPSRWYGAWFNGTQSDGGDLFGIGKQEKGTWNNLRSGRLGKQFGRREFVQLAISAIRSRLTLFVNGAQVYSVRDTEYDTGTIWISGNGLFRNAEYQILDNLTDLRDAGQ